MFPNEIPAKPMLKARSTRQYAPRRNRGAASRVMICTTDASSARNLTALLLELGHDVEQYESYDATISAATTHLPDLVILDDQGADLENIACSAPLNDLGSYQVPIIRLVAENRRVALQTAARDVNICVQKPVNGLRFQNCVQKILHAKRQNDHAIAQLAQAVEAKDAYTQGHLYRISLYASAIGKLLQLPRDEMIALYYGALLHDVGKLYIDEAIIRKEGPLTDDEYRKMQRHTIFGERIVRERCSIGGAASIVRYHHERWGGGGYPDGIAREAIPLGARIVAVVDAFDAMTTQRPYNRVMSQNEAIGELRMGAGTYWDPRIVAVFITWLQAKDVETSEKSMDRHAGYLVAQA